MITSWMPNPDRRVPSEAGDVGTEGASGARVGNLFGMVRTDQPGPSAREPFVRCAAISGGVDVSFPSQNGQSFGEPGAGGRAYSFGRAARPSATIAHRPVIASCRNSFTGRRLDRATL